MNANNTLLEIKLAGASLIPLYSARGLTQTLEPIDAAIQVEYDVNGNAMDLSWEQFRKYKSEIACTDVETPAIDGVWPGQLLVIDCVKEMSYRTGGTPQRTVIAGSSRVEGSFTFYRPRLTMMFLGLASSMEEYPATYRWVARFTEA